MDLEIKIEEEEDPMLAEIVVPPILVFDINNPPSQEVEPVIECPDSWQQEERGEEYDPLHTEEFRIVPIERLIASRRIETSLHEEDIEEQNVYEEEVDTEMYYEEAACSPVVFSDTEVETQIPSLPPCSIKLDKNEIMKYYCSESKKFKYPNKTKQNRRKQIWRLPPYKCKTEIHYKTQDASTSTMDLDAPATPESSQSPITISPCWSPIPQDISETSDFEVENIKPKITIEDNKEKVEYGFRKRKHTCNYCNKICASDYILKEHLKLHAKDIKIENIPEKKKIKVYRCTYCYIKFTSVQELKNHKRIHGKSLPYLCTICKNRYKLKTDILKHHKIEHPEIIRPKCDLCSITTSKLIIDLNEMEYHLRTVHIKKYVCKICDYKSGNKSHLIKHKNRVHFNFNCKIIGNELINCEDMNIKYEIMPPNNKIWPFMCHKCSFHTTNAILLRQHLESKHGKPSKFICKECKFPCRSKNHLYEHKNLHKKSKVESKNCKICNIKYYNLEKHLKIHLIIKPFKCEICECLFKHKTELQTHYKIKHPEFIVNYNCDACNESSFIDKNDFTNHMLKCYIKSAYHCNICDLYFINEKSYIEHTNIPHYAKENERVTRSKTYGNIKTHRRILGKNTYKCKQCQMTFAFKNELQLHMYSIHPERGIFLCRLCNNRYEYKLEMIKHCKYEHDMKYKTKCNICSKISNTPEKMTIHLVNKHFKYIYETTGKINIRFKAYMKILDQELINTIMNEYCLFFTSSDEIPNNLKENYDGNICKCNSCDLKFEYWNALLKHKVWHIPGKPYLCFICKSRYRHFGELCRHIKTHACIKLKKSYFCDSCNDSFYLRSNMKIHLKTKHLKLQKTIKKSTVKTEVIDDILVKNEVVIENISYYCIICNLIFDTELNYTTHCNLHHDSNKIADSNLVCDFCDTAFNSEIEFKDHVLNGHLNSNDIDVSFEKNVNKHECMVCKKSFNSNVRLRGHVSSFHSKPGSCPYCDNIYRKLASHINKVHLDFTEKQCKYCTQKFVGVMNLKLHINVDHTEERYKKYCKFCNDTFKDKKSLKSHLKLIHNQVPKFLCHLCAYDCSNQSTLINHIKNRHNPDKKPKPQAKCPKCNKLIMKANLNNHIRTAHRGNRLDCNVCGFKCKSFDTLRQHKFVMHNIGFVKRHRNTVGEFECTVCFRKYKFHHTMINHYNREHVPCVCDICDRQLQGKHSMEKHLEYSHGMKLVVHPCQLCEHVALTPGRLIKHMASKHGIHNFKYQNL